MKHQQSSTQEKNIRKMNEVIEEKGKKNSEEQNFDPQEQRNQSLKDNAQMPDENNKLTNSDNNRNP